MGLQLGYFAMMTAAMPDMCGALMLVPVCKHLQQQQQEQQQQQQEQQQQQYCHVDPCQNDNITTGIKQHASCLAQASDLHSSNCQHDP
jgi:hypothetical protein